MARSLILMSCIFTTFLASIHARSLGQQLLQNAALGSHHVRVRAVPCPAGMCLSKFGYCGTSAEYCGEGCRGGPCYGAATTLPSIIHINSTSGNSGPCPAGMCLSKFSYCGTSAQHCGEGCQSGACYKFATTIPSVVNVTLPSVGTTALPTVNNATLLPSVNDHAGEGTFYNPGIGACGTTNNGNELVCAMAAPDFDSHTPNGNPNYNDLCDRFIQVTGPKGTVNVRVVDRCPVCKSGDLDLSPAAFNQIGDPQNGRIPIDWHFI